MRHEEVVFSSDVELIDYVDDQARPVLPQGWTIERSEEELTWRILPPGERTVDYILRVSSDRTIFMILHGNTDEGPIRLDTMLYNAKVMDLESLRFFPLGVAIADVIQTCKLNRWGLT
jgi:hypothetical protein